MSYLIVLCVAAVEALSLVLLWTALRVSMPRVARPFVACCGLSLAWGAWILVLVLRGPLWMMGVTGAVLALSSAATGLALHLALSEEEEEDHDGGAGVAPTVGPEVPGGGGNDEPPWWPEFERQLAAYAARRDRERQPVA
jgi:hypothetical protein